VSQQAHLGDFPINLPLSRSEISNVIYFGMNRKVWADATAYVTRRIESKNRINFAFKFNNVRILEDLGIGPIGYDLLGIGIRSNAGLIRIDNKTKALYEKLVVWSQSHESAKPKQQS